MSKIGKLPVEIKSGVTVTIANGIVSVTGPKGTLTYAIPQGIAIAIADGKAVVSQKSPESSALFGLTRAQLANMVKGVSDGFEKRLEMTGVGYRAQAGGTNLTLSVGYSHPVKMEAPKGVTFAFVDNQIVVSGADKTLVGNTAAKVRAVRPPEPYKGKGIKYVGERIRRKAGKAAKAVGAK